MEERLIFEIDARKVDYTYSDYSSWPDWFRCELLAGQVCADGLKRNHVIRVFAVGDDPPEDEPFDADEYLRILMDKGLAKAINEEEPNA